MITATYPCAADYININFVEIMDGVSIDTPIVQNSTVKEIQTGFYNTTIEDTNVTISFPITSINPGFIKVVDSNGIEYCQTFTSSSTVVFTDIDFSNSRVIPIQVVSGPGGC